MFFAEPGKPQRHQHGRKQKGGPPGRAADRHPDDQEQAPDGPQRTFLLSLVGPGQPPHETAREHQRDTSSVLTEQKANTSLKMDSLLKMREHAYQLQALTGNGKFEPERFGRILDESWQLKRQLAGTITTDQIDRWYEIALGAGAEGGKLCGAGGGGFLLFIVKPEHQQSVRRALGCLTEVSVGHEVHGSQVVLPFAH